jgi:hypothetical protein
MSSRGGWPAARLAFSSRFLHELSTLDAYNQSNLKLAKPMTEKQPYYLSYLLRLWRVNSGGSSQAGEEGTVWRASLQDPLTDERVNFASLEDLVAFLRRQMGLVSDADRDEGGSKA